MRRLFLAAALISISACASQAETPQTPVQRGQELVETNCGTCHATGVTGESPAPEAPAFRTLSENYRVSDLQEALAEGISVGHPAMPVFEFTPEDVDAVIAYLQSVQPQAE